MLLVEVLDAVDVVGGIHGKRDAVQAPVTHHTGKAVRVVSFARRPQDPLHDGLTADVAGLQSVLKIHKDKIHSNLIILIITDEHEKVNFYTHLNILNFYITEIHHQKKKIHCLLKYPWKIKDCGYRTFHKQQFRP